MRRAVSPSTVSHLSPAPPTCQPPFQTCSRMGVGVGRRVSPTSPQRPPGKEERGGGRGADFVQAAAGRWRPAPKRAGSWVEAPADGLPRTARPPRPPRLPASSLPRLPPLKILRPSVWGSRRVPWARLSGEEKGAESEGRGRATESPDTPGLFRRAQPPPGVELQELLIAMLMANRGWGERAADSLCGKGKFLFSPSCAPRPPGSSQPALRALPSPSGAGKASGQPRPASPSSERLTALRPHAGTVRRRRPGRRGRLVAGFPPFRLCTLGGSAALAATQRAPAH